MPRSGSIKMFAFHFNKMDTNKLKSAIESMLFISGEPLKISRIAKTTNALKPEIENALMLLAGEYASKNSGLQIIRKGDEVQMATNPDNAQYVEELIKGELQESLSAAALEVISIIAYRGPITRADIESIRGVNSSFTLRNLLLRGLIGRQVNPKDTRSYVYEITFDFLRFLGLSQPKDLPGYDALSQDSRIKTVTSNQEKLLNS